MAFRQVPYDNILGLGNKKKKAEKKLKKAEKAIAKGNLAKAEKKVSKAIKKGAQVSSEKRGELQNKINATTAKIQTEKKLKEEFVEAVTPVTETPPNTGTSSTVIDPVSSYPTGEPTVVPPSYSGGGGSAQGWEESYSSTPYQNDSEEGDTARNIDDPVSGEPTGKKSNLLLVLIVIVAIYFIYKHFKK